jgi:hypothetical protein
MTFAPDATDGDGVERIEDRQGPVPASEVENGGERPPEIAARSVNASTPPADLTGLTFDQKMVLFS